MAAFAATAEAGADGVELDVQRSADRVPVVIHDETLDRTTNGVGAAASLAASVLEKLDAGGGGVPTLAQAAGWAAATGQWLNVEIKASGVEREVIDILRAAGVMDRVILSSFSAESVATLAELASSARRYLLTESWSSSVLRTVRDVRANGVCLRVDASTPATIDEIRRLGLPLVVWTVDEPGRIEELLNARVQALITNDPAAAVAIRSRLEKERR